MKNLFILSLIVAISLISCKSTAQTEKKPEPAKVNFKGETLPELNIRPGTSLTLHYDNDNDTTLNNSELRRLDAVIEFLKVNKDYSMFFKAYMHEQEESGTAQKRTRLIKERAEQAGLPTNRALAGKTKPLIPQRETHEFTPEEVIDARRVDIQVIK